MPEGTFSLLNFLLPRLQST